MTPLLSLALLAAGGGPDFCNESSFEAFQSCRREALSDFWLARALCSNLPTLQERLQCAQDARDDLADEIEECEERLGARLELCDDLGGGIYHPDIDPANFVATIDNPYFPLVPGTTYVYEKQTPEGLERVETTVTDETIEILGVTCTTVHDVETLDGEVVEDTLDWYAQDAQGNVWYFGELSMEVEDGLVVSLDGSFRAGEDGAQPGIIMLADPQPGDVYRQEFALREAEDAAAVLSLTESISVPFGAFDGCALTEDFTPLEPGNVENKFYAPGVGLVAELDLASGELLELIEVITK